MIAINGYSVEQYPNQNQIVITLPQTTSTMTNTVSPVSKSRRDELNPNELTVILTTVMKMLERGNDVLPQKAQGKISENR